MKVRWTTPAVNQLRNIFDYMAADSPRAATRVVGRIREVVRQTGRMPNVGRIGRVEGTREIVVSGTPYLVVYWVVEKTIHVLAIFHGAQKWPESF
ncbi:MAG: type II toxin-antitoxin system RelE/ParE family toxin [Terracidiphilus sp.]